MKLEKILNEFIIELSRSKVIHTQFISDGYHNFQELYLHRNLLFIYLCRGAANNEEFQIWRTRKSKEGKGMIGWFILGCENIETKEQITYHLPSNLWNICSFAEHIPKSRWNGHTSSDTIKLLKHILSDD